MLLFVYLLLEHRKHTENDQLTLDQSWSAPIPKHYNMKMNCLCILYVSVCLCICCQHFYVFQKGIFSCTFPSEPINNSMYVSKQSYWSEALTRMALAMALIKVRFKRP